MFSTLTDTIHIHFHTKNKGIFLYDIDTEEKGNAVIASLVCKVSLECLPGIMSG